MTNPASFSKGTARLFAVQGLATTVLAILQLASVMVLSRLLEPEDFGYATTASVAAFLGAAVADVGFGATLVRSRQLTNTFASAILAWSIAAFTLSSIATFVIVDSFWSDSRITSLAAIASVSAFFMGLSGVFKAPLQRDQRYLILFLVNAGSYSIGMIAFALALAASGMGPYSIVLGQLTYSVFACAIAIIAGDIKWNLNFRWSIVRPLFRFGSAVVANRGLDIVLSEGDKFFMAKISGFAVQGAFERQNRIAVVSGGHLSFIIDSVLYPVISRARNDRNNPRMTSFLLMASALASCVFIIAAPLTDVTVAVILGEPYRDFSSAVLLLLIGSYFRVQARPMEVFFRATGRPHLTAWAKAAPATMLIIGLIVVADRSFEAWATVFVISQGAVLLCQALIGWFQGASRVGTALALAVHTPASAALMYFGGSMSLTLNNVTASGTISAAGGLLVIATALLAPRAFGLPSTIIRSRK